MNKLTSGTWAHSTSPLVDRWGFQYDDGGLRGRHQASVSLCWLFGLLHVGLTRRRVTAAAPAPVILVQAQQQGGSACLLPLVPS